MIPEPTTPRGEGRCRWPRPRLAAADQVSSAETPGEQQASVAPGARADPTGAQQVLALAFMTGASPPARGCHALYPFRPGDTVQRAR